MGVLVFRTSRTSTTPTSSATRSSRRSYVGSISFRDLARMTTFAVRAAHECDRGTCKTRRPRGFAALTAENSLVDLPRHSTTRSWAARIVNHVPACPSCLSSLDSSASRSITNQDRTPGACFSRTWLTLSTDALQCFISVSRLRRRRCRLGFFWLFRRFFFAAARVQNCTSRMPLNVPSGATATASTTLSPRVGKRVAPIEPSGLVFARSVRTRLDPSTGT
jgi:hypothetical protein